MNKYAYARNNPITLLDADGKRFSLSGAGKVIEQVSQVNWAVINVVSAVTPGISDGRDAYEVVTGTDLITQQPLTEDQKALTAFGVMAIGTLSGAELRAGADIIKGTMRAIDVTRISQKYNWGRTGTLIDHFERHGIQFGAENAEDYASQANEFYRRGMSEPGGGIEIDVGSDGRIRMYESSTNTFGSFNPDGSTATYYKPDRGADYWAEQKNLND